MNTATLAYKTAYRLNVLAGEIAMLSSSVFGCQDSDDKSLSEIARLTQAAAMAAFQSNAQSLEVVIKMGHREALEQLANEIRNGSPDAAYVLYLREIVRITNANDFYAQIEPESDKPASQPPFPNFSAKPATLDDSDVQAAHDKAIQGSSEPVKVAWRKVNRQNAKIDNMTQRTLENRLDDLRAMIAKRASMYPESLTLQKHIDEYEAIRLRRPAEFARYCKRYALILHTAIDLIS